MGCVMSQAEKEAARKSIAIDKTLASENVQKRNEIKLLLLGELVASVRIKFNYRQ